MRDMTKRQKVGPKQQKRPEQILSQSILAKCTSFLDLVSHFKLAQSSKSFNAICELPYSYPSTLKFTQPTLPLDFLAKVRPTNLDVSLHYDWDVEGVCK